MTSKNLSTITEKTILISSSGIVSRLRSAICILIFSTCILWVQNNCFAQAFTNKVVEGVYNSSDLSKVIQPGQAFLLYKYAPRGAVTNLTVFTYQDVVSGRVNIDFRSYSSVASYGRVKPLSSNIEEAEIIAIIDAENYYFGSNANLSISSYVSRMLNTVGLGTINARRNLISIVNGGVYVTPYDFRGYIQPWIIAGLVIAILIPAWYLCRRFLRG